MGTIYEIYPVIRGVAHTPGDLAQIESAGRLLGALHSTTADTEGTGKRIRRFHDPRAIVQGLEWAKLQVGKLPGPANAMEGIGRLLRVGREIGKRLPDTGYEALPHCIIHGDYHPANVLYEGSEISGLFDFDWVARAPRAVDISDGLIFWCARREKPFEPSQIESLTQPFVLEAEWLKAFGKGYASAVKPTVYELKALPELMRARWLFSRVDAMQRKVPEARKLTFLLDRAEGPLEQIAQFEGSISGGEWLKG
jgi:Ser/Thr protein kinase RdoA (MazF antagonist)